MRVFGVVLFVMVLCVPGVGRADVELDKTLSPYFIVQADGADVDVLPLKQSEAKVSIAGVIAEVVVKQTYVNTGTVPLEAVYVFPGSTRAAVHGMQMRIGDRVRKAQIREKRQAKAEYNAAKKQGKSASLLEQHRPNVFQMSVANIMPTDVVEVELRYTELLVPTDGMYQFVYPTVVGPRYSGDSTSDSPNEHASGTQAEAWVKNPYTAEKVLPTYTFDMEVHVASGVPIHRIASSSHKINVAFEGKEQATVRLAAEEQFGGNRDFILSYALQGGVIESGLLLHRGTGNSESENGENFFLLMAQPPKRIEAQQMPAREYIFVVDVSGSMYGFPLDVSKAVLRNLIATLRPEDRFNVLLFAGSSSLLSDTSLPGTEEHIESALALLDRQQGGGGTELLPALQRAMALPREQEQVSRSIVVVTDGYISAETESFDLIRKNAGTSNVFAFGIGSSVNRYLIEGLARVGQGEAFVVTRAQEAMYVGEKFRSYIATPVLTNISVAFEGFTPYEVQPAAPADLFAERPLLVFGKWRGAANGAIVITGTTGEGAFTQRIPVTEDLVRTDLPALSFLWARDRIASLADYNRASHNASLVKEITDLGLRYSLLTEYTSFIAVDELVRNPAAQGVEVQQALPLPQGVSNFALGSTIPSVPEPEFYAMLMLLLACALWQTRSQWLHSLSRSERS